MPPFSFVSEEKPLKQLGRNEEKEQKACLRLSMLYTAYILTVTCKGIINLCGGILCP